MPKIYKNERLIASLPDTSGTYLVDGVPLSLDVSGIDPSAAVQTVKVQSPLFGEKQRAIEVSPIGRGKQQLNPEDFLLIHLFNPVRYPTSVERGVVQTAAHPHWQAPR